MRKVTVWILFCVCFVSMHVQARVFIPALAIMAEAQKEKSKRENLPGEAAQSVAHTIAGVTDDDTVKIRMSRYDTSKRNAQMKMCWLTIGEGNHERKFTVTQKSVTMYADGELKSHEAEIKVEPFSGRAPSVHFITHNPQEGPKHIEVQGSIGSDIKLETFFSHNYNHSPPRFDLWYFEGNTWIVQYLGETKRVPEEFMEFMDKLYVTASACQSEDPADNVYDIVEALKKDEIAAASQKK